ncbi:MAG: SO_0444 family Cu/Zn efflux transporter [Gammaproteobacteria bacterium]|nr:SO_0444 family Cu/Zn efflux transporter [Gammaproteobacteria bacterium]MCW8958607.1 SO_0444 family Cu/Zn efflux transporter [Gammaproteobacteria bacterium]MCW8973973.1 SO_0444 family Cu/Zn efflux transporter [Gammaproteobacteria bacterium]MCW8993785.1 SO_0444 family Cu/Zn efflux transporter [Gammaproteobacteria bacterium]
MIAGLGDNTLALYLDAAPWLLLGLLAAGLIKAWVADSLLLRWLGGKGIWPVVRAALIGAPLPLCSCGVLPAALGLHRGGASRPATVSFLIATPETGADSIAVSYALLGPLMAVVRPLAAILSAITTGLLTTLVPVTSPANTAAAEGCSSDCCNSGCTTPQPPARTGALATTLQGLRYAVTDILDDIALWLAIGIVLAGVVATLVPPQALAAWGSGLPAMGVMLLVGVPMYICATASTPLAAALLLAGISPGTVLVFLLAGPATNIATLAVVRKELGDRILATYLAGIALSSITLGLLLDWLLGRWGVDVVAQMGEGGELIPSWLAWLSGTILLLLAIRPLRRRIFELKVES